MSREAGDSGKPEEVWGLQTGAGASVGGHGQPREPVFPPAVTGGAHWDTWGGALMRPVPVRLLDTDQGEKGRRGSRGASETPEHIAS